MNIFFVPIYLSFLRSVIFDECDLPPYKGLVISKYYRETCPHCQRITPLINEIDERLERHGIEIQVRNFECGKCNCSKNKIDAVPTIVLTKDSVEIGRFRGYRDYDEIVDFLCDHTGIDKNLLKMRSKNMPGKVLKLKEKDFYSGFEGPWIMLFYNDKEDKRHELMEELGKFYKNRLHLGTIHQNDAKKIELRYGITKYPSIIATYNGIMVDYTGTVDLGSLIDFCDILLSSSLEEVTIEKLDEITSELKFGEPVFVVFYSHLDLANSYFRKLAHEIKFRAKIFKTSDNALFDKAGIHPKSKDSDKSVKDNDAVILTVYRNNIFHRYDQDLNNEQELLNWIFHTHYPYITKIDNTNFNTIFHGFKPALLLITYNESLVDEFEKFSENRHMGLAYSDYVYGILDAKEFIGIIKYFLPKIKLPTFVIFDPTRKKFHSENTFLDKENFFESGHRILRKYDQGILKTYPFKKHYLRNSFFLFTIGVMFGGFFYTRKKSFAKIE